MSALAATFILGLVVAALINILTALFSRERGLRLIPWLTFYVIVHGVYVVLSGHAAGYVMALVKRFHTWPSYAVVMLVAAVLAGLYWRAAESAIRALERVTTERHGQPDQHTDTTAPPLPAPAAGRT